MKGSDRSRGKMHPGEETVIGRADQVRVRRKIRFYTLPVVCVIEAVRALGGAVSGKLVGVLQTVHRRREQPACQEGDEQQPGGMSAHAVHRVLVE